MSITWGNSNIVTSELRFALDANSPRTFISNCHIRDLSTNIKPTDACLYGGVGVDSTDGSFTFDGVNDYIRGLNGSTSKIDPKYVCAGVANYAREYLSIYSTPGPSKLNDEIFICEIGATVSYCTNYSPFVGHTFIDSKLHTYDAERFVGAGPQLDEFGDPIGITVYGNGFFFYSEDNTLDVWVHFDTNNLPATSNEKRQIFYKHSLGYYGYNTNTQEIERGIEYDLINLKNRSACLMSFNTVLSCPQLIQDFIDFAPRDCFFDEYYQTTSCSRYGCLFPSFDLSYTNSQSTSTISFKKAMRELPDRIFYNTAPPLSPIYDSGYRYWQCCNLNHVDVSYSQNQPLSGWNHIVVTFESQTAIKMFLNGQEVSANCEFRSFNETTQQFENTTTTDFRYGFSDGEYPYYIGWSGLDGDIVNNQTVPRNLHCGKIGPIKIYNCTLTSSEVNQNFQALRNRFGI